VRRHWLAVGIYVMVTGAAGLLMASGVGYAQGNECATAPTGIVGWWPGNDDSLDVVGNNHGVAVNGALYSPGLVNGAFSFDGIDDYVNAFSEPSSFFSNSEAFTLEGWFRPESEAASYFMLRNAAFGLRWQGSPNSLRFYNGTDHFSSKNSWQIGRWYHVALVDDGVSTVKLYVDGVLDRSDDGPSWNPNRFPCHSDGYCFELQFGGYYETHDVEYFKGQVDEVTLYSRALSATEIHDIFLSGANGKCPVTDADGDGFSPPDDCDDLDSGAHPGATEVFDGRDNDCDGAVDEGLDDDGDGVPDFNDACNDTPRGVGVDPGGCPLCAIDPDRDGDGYPASADCNDNDHAVNPGAAETCNNVDDDCDGLIDEGLDADQDGYTPCALPVGDCNNANTAVKPSAQELPGNAVDENCDGSLGDCDPSAAWRNHGEFVRCVTAECEQLVAAGVLSEAECDVLVSQAGQSAVGK